MNQGCPEDSVLLADFLNSIVCEYFDAGRHGGSRASTDDIYAKNPYYARLQTKTHAVLRQQGVT